MRGVEVTYFCYTSEMKQESPSPSLKPRQAVATDWTSGLLPRPVLPSELASVVNRLPLTPRPTWPGRCGAPLPIALGEVEKLCLIEQGAGRADLELPPVSGPWPVVITAETEDNRLSSPASIPTLGPHVDQALRVLISAMLLDGFELFEPSKCLCCAQSGLDPSQAPGGLLTDAKLDVLKSSHRQRLKEALDGAGT